MCVCMYVSVCVVVGRCTSCVYAINVPTVRYISVVALVLCLVNTVYMYVFSATRAFMVFSNASNHFFKVQQTLHK